MSVMFKIVANSMSFQDFKVFMHACFTLSSEVDFFSALNIQYHDLSQSVSHSYVQNLLCKRKHLNSLTRPFEKKLPFFELGHGRGGMVFLHATNPDLVTKILFHSDISFFQEILAQYCLSTYLGSDYAPLISSVYRSELSYFIVMKKIDGFTLKDWRQKTKLTFLDKALFLFKLAYRINQMHGLNFTHNDIHQNNILVERRTNNPVLIDFGFSKLYYPSDRDDIRQFCRILYSFFTDASLPRIPKAIKNKQALLFDEISPHLSLSKCKTLYNQRVLINIIFFLYYADFSERKGLDWAIDQLNECLSKF